MEQTLVKILGSKAKKPVFFKKKTASYNSKFPKAQSKFQRDQEYNDIRRWKIFFRYKRKSAKANLSGKQQSAENRREPHNKRFVR